MKRIACLMVVAVLAACGSDSTGPTNRFSGTWTGDAIPDPTDTIVFQLTAIQNGTSVSGTGMGTARGTSDGIVFTGTATATTLFLQMAAGPAALTYSGTFVTSDSIAGTITEDNVITPLDLKKQ